MSSFFLKLKKQTNKQTNKTKTEVTRQQKLEISNYNFKYPAISSFTVFYITRMLYVSITNKIAKPKIFPMFFKKYE